MSKAERKASARLIMWWHELNCLAVYRDEHRCTCQAIANNVMVGELNPSLYKITKPPADWIPNEYHRSNPKVSLPYLQDSNRA